MYVEQVTESEFFCLLTLLPEFFSDVLTMASWFVFSFVQESLICKSSFKLDFIKAAEV